MSSIDRRLTSRDCHGEQIRVLARRPFGRPSRSTCFSWHRGPSGSKRPLHTRHPLRCLLTDPPRSNEREKKRERIMVSPAQQGLRWTNENPCTYFGTCMFKVNGFRSHDVQKNFEHAGAKIGTRRARRKEFAVWLVRNRPEAPIQPGARTSTT